MDNTKELRTISLCTGYGGIERGIELCGERIKPIVTCEIEAYAIALNLKRMEGGEVEAHPIWSDLKTFPVGAIPKGSVDLLTGGFPCQPFSAAGKRRASEDPRHLWPHITKIIRSIKPVRCFFENVEGLVSAKTCEHLEEIQRIDDLISAEKNPRTRWDLSGWRERFYRRLLKTNSISALHLVLCQLEELGYKATWGIFSAEECGAPHRRKRIFILSDSRSDSSHPGHERAGRKTWANIVGGGYGPELAEPTSCGHRNPKTATGKGQASIRKAGKAGRVENGECTVRLEGSGYDELPNSTSLGGRQDNRKGESKQLNENGSQWPSRPRQPQHEWEPPRVVVDTPVQRLSQRGGAPSQQSKEIKKLKRSGGEELGVASPHDRRNIKKRGQALRFELSSWRQIKSRLGGIIAGIAHRVDRLRMLGNGVVPQTAAIAWITLNRRILENQ